MKMGMMSSMLTSSMFVWKGTFALFVCFVEDGLEDAVCDLAVLHLFAWTCHM